MSNNITISDKKILDGTNYLIWYDAIESAAKEIDLLEYLKTDKIKQYEEQHPGDQDGLNKIKKDNNKLRSIIINSITNSIHEEIIGIESVSVIIETLKTDYDKDTQDLTQWIKKLKSIKAKNNQEIPRVIRKVEKIFKNMADAKKTMDEKEKIKYFLHTLPKSYREKITLKDTDTVETLSKEIKTDLSLWSYVDNWDSDNSVDSDDTSDDPMDIGFISKNKNKNKKKNFRIKSNNKYNNSNELKHNKNKNFNYNRNNNNNHNKNNNYHENYKYCEICERKGHSIKECHYNIKNPKSNYFKYYNKNYNNNSINYKHNKNGNNNNRGYAGYIGTSFNLNDEYNYEICNSKKYNKDNKKYLCFINRVNENFKCKHYPRVNKILCNIHKNFKDKFYKNNNNINNNCTVKSVWLYDSGAGEHITNNKELLKNFKQENIKLNCANGSPCEFEGYGEFEFEINNTKIKLERVYYSKNVIKNMISGVELARTNIKAILENINNEVVLKLLDQNYKPFASFNANKNNEINIVVTSKINTMNDKSNIMAIQNFDNFNDLIWHRRLGHYYHYDLDNYLKIHNADRNCCPECRIAKMKRKPHNKPTPKATDVLEVIHSDIIGPIDESYTGNRFILTMIDEFSRKAWLFLLKEKKQAIDYIINTLKYLKNVYPDKNIKYFKSDYGREYNNKEIKKYCRENGIQKVFAPPYNPENNGLAERYNQTVISCTKTLLYWSGLSENFWDYAVTYANYLYNKTPHSSINNRIPDEIFYKRKTKINHIRVFGCLTYYKNYENSKTKFSPEAKKGVFLGFSEKSNSYIIMDFEDFKIHKVREIFCMEDYPSDLKISNKNKTRFLGKKFLDFDFNFTKITDIENEIDSIPNNEKMKYLRDNYIAQNKQNLNNNQHSENLENNGNSSNIHNNKNLVINLNNNHNKNDKNDDILHQNQNFQNINSDKNNSINKNFQKFEENNVDNKNLSNQTLNNNENVDKNFSISSPQTLNNNNNVTNIQSNNNLNLNPETLNNNKIDNNNLIYDSHINNNNQLNENNISDRENFNKFNNNDTPYLENNFNTFNTSNDINNIWQSSSNNILPISNYNDIDRVLDYNKEQFNNSNVNTRRSNIKTLTIKDNQNIPNSVTKIKDILAHNRLYVSTNKPKIKFKRASINLDDNNNNIDIALINKNKNKNNMFTSHKTIYKRKPFATSKYFNKYKKHIKVFNKSKFIGNINNQYKIPKNYFQAINSKDSIHWINAINDELNNLYSNNIMTFVKFVPANKTIITTRWVFTIKTDSDGNIIKFKARLVARGYDQKFGFDFDLTYSPTLNVDCLKLIFSLAAKFNWYIHQIDIKAAYLNADLDYDIYVTIPPGDTNFGRGYWKLNKALYGLKQSGRQWYKTICNFLKNNNFTQLKSESCVFKKEDKNKKLVCIIAIYVDDMAITGYMNEIKDIVNKIENNFKISKSGPIDYILGIKVENNNNIYTISQINFIDNILNRFNINNLRKINTPCVGDNIKGENNKPFDPTIYKSAIGMLIFLSKCTRPDIAFAVNKAARNSEHPTISDWNKVVNILKYLKTNKYYKITYDGKGEIMAYTDSDFAGDLIENLLLAILYLWEKIQYAGILKNKQ